MRRCKVVTESSSSDRILPNSTVAMEIHIYIYIDASSFTSTVNQQLVAQEMLKTPQIRQHGAHGFNVLAAFAAQPSG